MDSNKCRWCGCRALSRQYLCGSTDAALSDVCKIIHDLREQYNHEHDWRKLTVLSNLSLQAKIEKLERVSKNRLTRIRRLKAKLKQQSLTNDVPDTTTQGTI